MPDETGRDADPSAAGFAFRPLDQGSMEAMSRWEYDQRFFPDFGVEWYVESAAAGVDPPTGPAGCAGYAVYAGEAVPVGEDSPISDVGQILGIFEYYDLDADADADADPHATGAVAIGFALAPSLVGRGLGERFLRAGVRHLVERRGYDHEWVYLDVALINVPARRLYDRVGFEPLGDPSGDGEQRMRAKVASLAC